MEIGVHRIAMNAPNDTSELDKLIAAGTVDPATIIALVGKTEGNGGANDFTRGFATLSYQLLLGRHLGRTPEDIGGRVAFVWSGGCEGVLSPHATVFTRTPGGAEAAEGTKRLALGIETTRDFRPEEVGTMAEVEEVAAAVTRALAAADIADPADVHYVQVKGPLLTPAGIADAERRGKALVTRDPNGSKAYARGATALGVAVALGEVAESDLSNAAIARRLDLYSSVASTSAGGELTSCEVLVFGNARSASGALRIGHAVLEDAIDAEGVRSALRSAGLVFPGQPVP